MKYFKLYITLLLFYFVFSTTWIEVDGTFPALPKIIATSACMLVLAFYAINDYGWSGLLLFPFSVFLWALIVDGFTGLWFHGDFFYLSTGTWPDKHVARIVNNGELYFIFKSIGLLVTGGLFYYLNDRKP